MKLCSFFLLFSAIILFSAHTPKDDSKKITATELKAVAGMHTGSLNYKDYTSGERVTLPLVGVSYFKKNSLIIEHLIYEGTEVYRQKYVYDFKGGILRFENGAATVLEKSISEGGQNIQLVFSKKAKDGNENKKCTFRYTMNYQNKKFSIKKEVKFDDEKEYFLRNEYVLERYQ